MTKLGTYPPYQRVESGGFDVVASGTAITFEGNPISITYGTPSFPFRLIVDFKDDLQNTDPHVEATSPEPRALKLTMVNFNSQLGIGTSKPLDIGVMAGQRLYLHYRAYALADSGDKTLQYCVYTQDTPSNA